METHWDARYAQRTQRMASSAIRELLKMAAMPGVISFGGGLPAPEVFPIEEFKKASQKVLEEKGAEALQYSITDGYIPLREKICSMTDQYGIKLLLENVMITNGSQQALDLLGKIMINRGDKILVEAPTYLGALQAWNAYGAEYIQVETDEYGLIPEAVEKALRVSPKFIYLMPNFQNPTGKTLPLDRRERIIELADQYGVPIIEDDPYGKLRYEGEHITPVYVLDQLKRDDASSGLNGNVIYLSTFSKTLAPGVRLAWISAPKEVIGKFVNAKQGTDLNTSAFVQMIAYEIIKDKFLEEHMKVICEVYGRRRTLMLEALEEFFPGGVSWTKPQGGMFLWVTLPVGMNTTELLEIAVKQKVAFVPGVPFYPNEGGENTMRLNFSNATDDALVEGMKRLGTSVKEMLSKNGR
jgi:2-aminoadipate transaminase